MKIALVDDQRLFVDSLRAILENVDEGFHVVWTASNGVEALELADRTVPDLILMDVRMPEMDGVEATRRVHMRHPDVRIIMLTTFEDDEYVQSAISDGAAGYLLKSISAGELVLAIRAVAGGVVTIDPHVVQGMVSGAAKRKPPGWFDALSRKERQILGLIVQGYHNREIADQVHVAEQTARNYISQMYDKMGVSDRVTAVRLARDSGLF